MLDISGLKCIFLLILFSLGYVCMVKKEDNDLSLTKPSELV